MIDDQYPQPPWRFSQCFGEKNENVEVAEADVISAVQFDRTGDFLASGDRAGRVVLFQRNYSKRSCEYKFYTEFQSHEPEFDYLKSLEINEKINKLSWLPRTHAAHFLLSTNDKTVKLWKVKERQVQSVLENNYSLAQRGVTTALTLPKIVSRERVVAATPKRVYAAAHAYNIHSISPSSDGEVFISADDLRINLWNLNSAEIAFNVVDCKPPTIEDLTEVITSASFHPHQGNIFVYSTSRGSLRLCDLRDSALCDQSSQTLGISAPPTSSAGRTSGFFDEVLASITDVKFNPADGNLLVARDYMNTHVWDLRRESMPLLTLPVHDHIRPRMCDLYDNDGIFDKFECSFSGDGRSVLTGSYSNYLKVSTSNSAGFGSEAPAEGALNGSASPSPSYYDDLIHADKSIFRNPSALKRTRSTISKSSSSGGTASVSMSMSVSTSTSASSTGSLRRSASWDDFTNIAATDFNKKLLHFSPHPRENSVAIASVSNLFIFSQI